MLAMVSHNLGVCILPELVVRDISKNVVRLPLNPPMERVLGVRIPSAKKASPAASLLIEQLQRFEKLPFTMYPAGGTAMLTVRQVGECIVGAAEQVQGFRAYGISCYNMHWREFLKIVYRAMDGIQDRKIVDVPKWTFQAFGLHMRKEYAKRNVQSGIDPVGLADIMGMDLFIPTDDTKELGCTPDDIEAAIFDSIALSKASFEGKAKLLEMKGE